MIPRNLKDDWLESSSEQAWLGRWEANFWFPRINIRETHHMSAWYEVLYARNYLDSLSNLDSWEWIQIWSRESKFAKHAFLPAGNNFLLKIVKSKKKMLFELSTSMSSCVRLSTSTSSWVRIFVVDISCFFSDGVLERFYMVVYRAVVGITAVLPFTSPVSSKSKFFNSHVLWEALPLPRFDLSHWTDRKRSFAKKTGHWKFVTKWGAVHKNHPHAKNTPSFCFEEEEVWFWRVG